MFRRVLVAEDDADIRRLLVQALAATGRHFIMTGTGQAALTAWSEETFSLLVLDFMMPERTGLEVLRHIRAAGDGTPVILMSATMSEEIQREAQALGEVACVEKPFVLAELRAAADRILGRPSRDPRFRLGSLALQRGFLTAEQLKRALDVQRQEASSGAPPRRLGAICHAEGFLTRAELASLLHRQTRLLAGLG